MHIKELKSKETLFTLSLVAIRLSHGDLRFFFVLIVKSFTFSVCLIELTNFNLFSAAKEKEGENSVYIYCLRHAVTRKQRRVKSN